MKLSRSRCDAIPAGRARPNAPVSDIGWPPHQLGGNFRRTLDRKEPRMRLYYHPLSSNSRRVVLTAIHLDVDVELVVVDLVKGEHKAPEYQRLNPNGKVPLLDDDGFILWELHAIMQYLADGSPGQDLYPGDAPGARRRQPMAVLVGLSLYAGGRLHQQGTGLEENGRRRRRPRSGSRSRAGRRCSRRRRRCSMITWRATNGLRRTN